MSAITVDAGTTLQTVIRAATLADVPALVTLGRQQLAASYGGLVADTPGQLAILAATLITGGPEAALFVAERDGALVGMIGLVLYAHHCSGVPTVGEVTWYVDPAARGLGLRLLRRAEQWATAAGAQQIQLVAPANGDGARAAQLYAHLGYRPVETTYQRALRAEAS